MIHRLPPAVLLFGALLVCSCGSADTTDTAGSAGDADPSGDAAVGSDVVASSPDTGTTGNGAGSSPPAPAQDDLAETEDGTVDGDGVVPVGDAAALGLALELPAGMVARPLSDRFRESLVPIPTAGIRFLPSGLADSELGEMELADLEVRVYDLDAPSELAAWLDASGLAGSSTISVRRTAAGLDGLTVCPATMLSPGCSFVTAHPSLARVYQFIAVSPEAEAAVDSARLL